jgi:hypothetical protein
VDKSKDALINGWMTGCMNGWMDGDGWVGGWMDGWIGGWMDGWLTDSHFLFGTRAPVNNRTIIAPPVTIK